jgi:hypothetical protein
VAPIIVRRALSTPRDLPAVTSLLRDAGLGTGDALAAALGTDAWGVVLVAERAGQARGVAVARFLRDPGEALRVRWAIVDVLHVTESERPAEVLVALVTAAESEAQARECERFEVMVDARDAALVAALTVAGFAQAPARRVFERRAEPHEAPSDEDAPEPEPAAEPEPQPESPIEAAPLREITTGVRVRVDARASRREVSTLWSGALAFRTRWRQDRFGVEWSVDGCIGSREGDGDAMRFDAVTRALRETYLARPARVRADEALLAHLAALEASPGELVLAPDVVEFTLDPADVALFDLALATFVGLRADWIERRRDAVVSGSTPGLDAVSVSRHVALLFDENAYVGWRVRDPLACVRPMGWPEAREAAPIPEAHRARLAALVYDWMTVDAAPRVAPAEASDPEEVAHLVAIRERARELAEEPCAELDPTAAVARDIAAHIHWGWGFFRVE